MPTWLIWVIVIVVVVLIVAALVMMARRRRTEQRREQAEELREEASAHASGLSESQRRAEELRAKAELAKTEAERAEERAMTAEQGHQVEEATYEDKLREADRVDPEVNDRSSDYRPDVWDDQRSESATTSTPTGAQPRHAVPPEDTSVAQRTEDPEAEAASTSGERTADPNTTTETSTERPTDR